MKEMYSNKIRKIFRFKANAKRAFLSQLENYFIVKEIKLKNNKYKLNEEVKLTKGMFMRGEGGTSEFSFDKMEFISKNGFVSPDIIDKYNKNQKTPLTIPVWNIQKDILLKDYIKLYSGATIKMKPSIKEKTKTDLIPYKEIDNYVNKLTCWKWMIEQTKEIRFMPSLAQNKVQIGFIINTNHTNENVIDLLNNDIFNLSFDKKTLKEFISASFIKDFIYSERNDLTTNRESAILFGIPSNLIEGILVGREYEKDNTVLNKIKELFPNCYICNLDGIVIKD